MVDQGMPEKMESPEEQGQDLGPELPQENQEPDEAQMSQQVADVMDKLGVDEKTAAFVLDAKLNGFSDEEILDAIERNTSGQ